MLERIKTMCALPGVASREDAVRRYVMREAEGYADEMRVDALGNLIIWKKGEKPCRNKLMLAAHMDEVGVMVRAITEEGYVKFSCVGGIDRRILLGKRVLIGDRQVVGVIGLKAIHLTTQEERKKVPKLEDYYIDIGAKSRAEAEAMVELGDCGVFVSDAVEFGEGMLKAKAIDDRVGCAVMLELLREPLPMDCTFAFTAQEEVGTRGAFAAAFSVTPEIACVLEGTTAADSPAVDACCQVCWPGKGPVISWMDGGAIYDRELFEMLRGLAQENGIPWQMKHYLAGGTDAKAIQRTKAGVRVAGISTAVRYLHAPSSVASISDMEHMLTLARLFVHKLAETI